jgi:hypothetical protein
MGAGYEPDCRGGRGSRYRGAVTVPPPLQEHHHRVDPRPLQTILKFLGDEMPLRRVVWQVQLHRDAPGARLHVPSKRSG